MDAHAIYVILVAAIPIVGLFTNFLGALDKLTAFGHWLVRKVRPENAPGTKFRVPSRTVIAIVDPRPNALNWSVAKVVGQPGLQIVGDFNVTNIWDGHVRLLVGLLRYRRWFFFRKIVQTNPLVSDALSGMSGNYVVHSHSTAAVRLGFVFREPKPPKAPRSFVADVGFVDQFNNRHWLRRLRFKHPDNLF